MIRVVLAGVALALSAGCDQGSTLASAQEQVAAAQPAPPTCTPPPTGHIAEAGPAGQWLIDAGAKAKRADDGSLPDDPDAARVYVDFDGSVFWGGKVVNLSELKTAVSKHTRDDPGKPVWVEWHLLGRRGDVSDAVAAINAAGVEPIPVEQPAPPPASAPRVLFGPNGKPLAAATRPSPDVDVLVEWMGNFYPPAAIRERREGDVTVSMCIGPDGKARNVRLVRSSGSPDLDNATLNGLPSMRFHPACDAKGHPVDWCEPPYPLTVSWQMSSQ